MICDVDFFEKNRTVNHRATFSENRFHLDITKGHSLNTKYKIVKVIGGKRQVQI